MRRILRLGAACLLAIVPCAVQAADTLKLPILVPVTGFLALEGTSQRNGALLALKDAGMPVTGIVSDTGTAPEAAVNALEKAMRDRDTPAVVASMLGTQMLAMIPVADQYGVPLVTVSGTAKITEVGSRNVFRFFPGDAVVKAAHAKYAVEELKARRPALLYQTTAYGQSGQAALADALTGLGTPLVLQEGLATSVKDMLPVLSKVKASGADVLLLHLHAESTALVVRQAAEMGLGLRIVAGSAMHQPSTAALLDPAMLKDVCAETSTAPNAGGSPALVAFSARYREAYGVEPDAFAVGQYDGVRMVLDAIKAGATTAKAVGEALAGKSYQGLAMTYRSDGRGNMAHDAEIVCYDGISRTPRVARRYENAAGTM
jgi:branched-chain amino acid transport system substrate-binding protein